MAEETLKSSTGEIVPPKANPLAAPAVPHAAPAATAPTKPGTTVVGLRPGIKLPPKPGATLSGLKPGIRLPPKPGATVTGLKPGIKLPPKPGATVTGLKPGIKLPPKPGATATGLKLGVKLPARPVIRKPGAPAATPAPVASAPVADLPKVEPAPAPVAPAPVAPAPVADLPKVEPAPVESVAEKVPELEAVAPAPAPLEQLKAITQNLKSITAPIPPQAILRKTGIVADDALSQAQKQAAKAKTARISLSDAMGVAPIKNENLPMKTIRIKRPTDLPETPSSAAKPAVTPVLTPAADAPKAEADVDTSAPTKIATASTGKTTTLTQRKTLKISRPGGAVRPSGKFGVRKPTVPSATAPAAPAAPAADGAAPVADIPDMPAATSVAPMAAPAPAASVVPDVPKGVCALSVAIQVAACLAMGALAWLLYQDTQILPF